LEELVAAHADLLIFDKYFGPKLPPGTASWLGLTAIELQTVVSTLQEEKTVAIDFATRIGQRPRGVAFAQEIDDAIAQAQAIRAGKKPLRYFHINSQGYSIGSKTCLGDVFRYAGLEPLLVREGCENSWCTLDLELLAAAPTPDVFIVTQQTDRNSWRPSLLRSLVYDHPIVREFVGKAPVIYVSATFGEEIDLYAFRQLPRIAKEVQAIADHAP
jgi:hypothetical protein